MTSPVQIDKQTIDPNDTQSYTQTELSVDGHCLTVNGYSDRYECFWPSTQTINVFDSGVNQQFELTEQTSVSAYHDEERELADVDTYGDLKKEYSVHGLEELEFDFDDFTLTWGEEGSAANGNQGLEPYSIIISGQNLDPEPVNKLYKATNDINENEEIVNSLLQEVEEHLSS